MPNDGQRPDADRSADVRGPVGAGEVDARLRDGPAHAAARIGDRDDAAEGAVPAKLELDALALVLALAVPTRDGDQDRAHHGARQGVRRGGRDRAQHHRVSDQVAADQRAHRDAATGGNRTDELCGPRRGGAIGWRHCVQETRMPTRSMHV